MNESNFTFYYKIKLLLINTWKFNFDLPFVEPRSDGGRRSDVETAGQGCLAVDDGVFSVKNDLCRSRDSNQRPLRHFPLKPRTHFAMQQTQP
jgi:hypothetical protein